MITPLIVSITLIAIVAIICYTVYRVSANQKTRVDDVLARVERDVKRVDNAIDEIDVKFETLIQYVSQKARRNG